VVEINIAREQIFPRGLPAVALRRSFVVALQFAPKGTSVGRSWKEEVANLPGGRQACLAVGRLRLFRNFSLACD